MPRVSYVDPVDYKKKLTRDRIKGDMSDLKITQKDVGELWGVTQAYAGRLINNMTMDYTQFIQLVNKLGWSKEEVVRAVKL